jgi:FMN phosphatase YigB (HAD superfamily)
MRDTILFDLDGTLLPMDFYQFMELYFKNMAMFFSKHEDPKVFIDHLNDATEVTIKTNDGRLNEEIFMTRFNELSERDIEFYKSEWEIFYDTLFQNCKVATWQDEYIKKSVALLKEKGYKLGIATNPLLPRKSNIYRIEWAGLDPNDFSYLSAFEDNKYCKPNLEFYEEVLEAMNVKPEQCFMVGNDALEDMVAGKLGIETYLITDNLLNSKNVEIKADHVGTYKEFYEFVKGLDPIK